MRPRLLTLGLTLLALTAGTANAEPISGLYNTGVNGDGSALLTPDATDNHYVITSTETASPIAVAFRYPGTAWVPNETTPPVAGWISPLNPTIIGQLNGPFSYTTTFSLSNLADLSTAVITGRFTADDRITDVLLNGASVAVVTPGGLPTPNESYGDWFNFTISSGFSTGSNTLEFVTANTKNVVTGLIVQMSGTYTAVPEPASVTVAALGAAGFALMSLRRRRKASA